MQYRFAPLLEELPSSVPFVGPEHLVRESDAIFLARLGANENLFGPSPKVIEELHRNASGSWKYGDPEFSELRVLLAAHLGITEEELIVGEGIDGLLSYICRMFIEPNDCVVTSEGAYPTFNFHVRGYGGELSQIPYSSDHEDLQGLVQESKNTNAKLMYVSNPDNPMGTWWEESVVLETIESLPAETIMILDEAYGEFAPVGTVLPIDTSRRNLIRLRTFSKAYGLAGMRVGYAIANPDLISQFEKIRNHFGVGYLSQVAAKAALLDQEYLRTMLAEIEQSRQSIYSIAEENSLLWIDSATNFVAIDCGHDGLFARKILHRLQDNGIFVRMPSVAPLDRCIRVTCGPPEQMELFGEVLTKMLAEES